MRKFWRKYQDLIKQEIIKSFFIILVTLIAVTFWEKSKIHNEISFTKKIDIFSAERKDLLEISERFTENYGDLSLYVNDNYNSDFKNQYTYKTNVTKLKRLLIKTNLLLINSMIENDSLNTCRSSLNSEGHIFIDELDNANINNKRFADISILYDKVVEIYSKEITKEIK